MAIFQAGSRLSTYLVPITSTGVPILLKMFKTKDLTRSTKVTQDHLFALGLEEVNDANPINSAHLIITGANTPTPGRYKRDLLTDNAPQVVDKPDSLSTYGNSTTLAAQKKAIAGGWTLLRTGQSVALNAATAKTVTVFVKLANDINYVFTINKADYSTFGADLGLELATGLNTEAELTKTIRGASRPRPGVARRYRDNSRSMFGTFFASEKKTDLQSKGWKIVSSEISPSGGKV